MNTRTKAKRVFTGQGETMTIGEAHARIGKGNVTRQLLYLAAQRGELPSIKLGKRVLFHRESFEKWLNGSASGSAPTAA